MNGENLIKLQGLSDKHKQVAALLAQGLKRQEISSIVDYDPAYITWLTRDPMFKQYLAEMSEHCEARLEALFEKSVDVIADGMLYGDTDSQLKAARMQLEVTGRVGKNDRPNTATDKSIERLSLLAERLTGLLGTARQAQTIDGVATVISEREAA